MTSANMLSRREFLHLCGVTVAASVGLESLSWFTASADAEPAYYGRVIRPTPILARPHGESVGWAFPDTVVKLQPERGWIRFGEGVIALNGLQPMPYWGARGEILAQFPSPIEVVGPSAAVYSHCQINLQPLDAIGHGGTALALDWLPDRHGGWYQIGDAQGSVWGWTQVAHWRAAAADAQPFVDRLVLEQHSARLLAYQRDQLLAEFTVSAPAFEAHRSLMAARRVCTDHTSRKGVPWAITWASGIQMTGAYWHNEFGGTHSVDHIELPPAAARWIYHALQPGAALEIV